MRILKKTLVFLICGLIVNLYCEEMIPNLDAKSIVLPETVGHWERLESPELITSETIFNYMDGAGELYLGYRFHHLDVYEYVHKDHDSIKVELYDMETSDDAFGLLSLDWEGESIPLDVGKSTPSVNPFSNSPVALYGAGLLRVWSDNLFARIMIYKETPEAKQAIIHLGKAMVQGQKRSLPPDLYRRIPGIIGNTWELYPDQSHYFRSFAVLNSFYYISHENILDLDVSAGAIAATYRDISDSGDVKKCQFILIQYEKPERAMKALNRFRDAYLTEFTKNIPISNPNETPAFFKLEEGWFAYKLSGEYLAIVSGCPSQESARIFVERDWKK